MAKGVNVNPILDNIRISTDFFNCNCNFKAKGVDKIPVKDYLKTFFSCTIYKTQQIQVLCQSLVAHVVYDYK